MIGRHLESVGRTEPVFERNLAPSEERPTDEFRSNSSIFFYRVNIVNCNLGARAKVKGHRAKNRRKHFLRKIGPANSNLVAVLVPDLWLWQAKMATLVVELEFDLIERKQSRRFRHKSIICQKYTKGFAVFEPVFELHLALIEKRQTNECRSDSGILLSSYRVNVTSCNLCARAKVPGHGELKIEQNPSLVKLVEGF